MSKPSSKTPPKETKEEKIVNSQSKTIIITTLISSGTTLIVGLVVAFLGFPPFQDLVRNLGQPVGEPQALAIEQIPQQVFVYAGNNNPDGGGGTFWLILDDTSQPVYKMDYSLPVDKNGYAGLVFQFIEGQNLSVYKSVEFTLIFGKANDEIDFFFKDISNTSRTLHIVASGTNEMSLRYEFSNFNGINFNAIKEVGLLSETKFATGNHQVRIKDVRFVK